MVVDGPLLKAAGERFGVWPVAAVHGVQHVDSRPQIVGADVMAVGPSLPGAEGGDTLAMDVDGVVHGVEQVGGVAVSQVVAGGASVCLRLAVLLDGRFGPLPGPFEVGVGTLQPAFGDVQFVSEAATGSRRRRVDTALRGGQMSAGVVGAGDGVGVGVAVGCDRCGDVAEGVVGGGDGVEQPLTLCCPRHGSLLGDGEVVTRVVKERREPVRDHAP